MKNPLRRLDPLLAALRPDPKQVPPGQPLGVSGTPAYAGWLVTSENNAKLTGRTKYQTYTDILANVSIVGAGVRYFLNLVSKGSWKVEPAEDSGADGQYAAELVEDAINGTDTPWYRIVRRAAMFRFYGFSIAEWTAQMDPDGRALLADIEARPQITIERWDIDEGGTIAGVLQRAPRDQRVIYLPRSKLIYAVDDSLNDSPEGLGLFRHIAEPARRLERYQDLEGIGFEGDLRGMPIVRAPLAALDRAKSQGTLSQEALAQVLQPLNNFLLSHIKSPALGVMLDSSPYTSQDAAATPSSVPQWAIEIAKNDSSAQAEVASAIERLNREMARVIGVEHVLLGGDGKGSLALSRDKSDNFALTVDSTLAELRSTFEKDLVLPLLALNGIDPSLAPSFKTDAIAYRDIEQVTTSLLQMAQAGAVLSPDDPAVNEVRDLLGLSRQESISVETDAAGLRTQDPPVPRRPVPPSEQLPVAPKQTDTAARQRAAESDSNPFKTPPDAAPSFNGDLIADPGAKV